MATTYPTPKYTTDEILFEFLPLGSAGVNSTDDPSQLDAGQVTDAVNIIFERKIARTRSNLHGWGNVSYPSGTPTYAEAFSIQVAGGSAPQYMDFIVVQDHTNNTFYKLSLTTAVPPSSTVYQIQALTGTVSLSAAIPWSQRNPMIEYNGIILFGNASGGLVRWDPNAGTGLTLTQLTAVKPVYLTVHLDRVIAAYDLSVNGPKSPRTVFWSAPGDETTWSGGTTGSGFTVLDIGDYITGLTTINNMLVICRSSGFTVGTATGQAFPTYNFQKWSDCSTGVTWPDTLAVCDNVMYFVGADDIYTCDLNSAPKPIGHEIQTEFMRAVMNHPFEAGIPVGNFVGYITRAVAGNDWSGGVSTRYRRYYNLFPSQQAFAAGNPPYYHYKYSIDDGTWSKHSYADPMTPVVWDDSGDITSMVTGLPTVACDLFLDTARVAGIMYIMGWAESSGSSLIVPYCEQPAYITTRAHILGQLNKNARVQRVLLRTRDFGNQSIQVSVTSRYEGGTVGGGTVLTVPCGVNNDGAWVRSWADVGRVLGQDFVLQINVPANGQFATDGYGFLWGDEGDFRG